MASSAKLSLNDFFHGYRIRPGLHFKDSGVAIPAVEPLCVRPVGVNDVRDVPFSLKDDVKVERRHRRNVGIAGQVLSGMDNPLAEGLHPIDISLFCFW